jgi:hypothetical protein
MRCFARPATASHIGAGVPGKAYGAGSSGACDRCRERAWVCFLAEVPPVDALWVVPGGGIFVEGLFDRVAGLDIGRRR